MAAESRVLIVGEAFTLEINSTNSVDFYELIWSPCGMGEPRIGWYMFCEGELLVVDDPIEHRRNNAVVQYLFPPREGTLDEFVQRGILRE